jgi:hypothetical protein
MDVTELGLPVDSSGWDALVSGRFTCVAHKLITLSAT